MCPRAEELGGCVGSNACLVEQVWREPARDHFDLACELAFLRCQLQQPAGDRAEREQAAAKLRVVSAMRPRCREALQEPWASERSQLASQRLRRCDQQVAQLTEPGALGVDRSLPCGDERLQRLTFTAICTPIMSVRGEDAARGRTASSA